MTEESEKRSIANLLCRMFQEVLEVDQVDGNSHFFDLGGDSLSVADLLVRITDEFRVQLSDIDVFENPTPSALEAALTAQLES